MNEANYFFIFFDQNASVIYLTVAAQAWMIICKQRITTLCTQCSYLLTYVQLENDCLNKWHEILGRRLAYSLQAYNTAWTINFTKIVNITNLHCKVYTFWEGHKNFAKSSPNFWPINLCSLFPATVLNSSLCLSGSQSWNLIHWDQPKSSKVYLFLNTDTLVLSLLLISNKNNFAGFKD